MKRILSVVFICMMAITALAQQNADTLHQAGRNYMRTGDWGNAILVLNRALQQKPGDINIIKDIAYTYYLQKDFANSLQAILPVLDRADADVQCYQIAGTNYRAIEDIKEGKKIYTAGIKKFPNSGVLYSEYGELLWQKKDYSAIDQWKTGIRVDPNYPGNYYNAARHYYFTTDKVWSLVYGEIFVNLESYTMRTAEIKNILFDGYKKLFSESNALNGYDVKRGSAFETAFLTTMNTQSAVAATGITPEKLIEIRTAFAKTWFEKFADSFPYRLFDYHKQLITSNMFEAYNQWMFGAAIKPEHYQQWMNDHKEAYDRFNNFQRGRVFKLPAGQYYQNK